MRSEAIGGGELVRARLKLALGRLGTPLTDAAPLASGGTLLPFPRTAACSRRCENAATNELFTDIEASPDLGSTIRVPRLRLCHVA